jgi:hypothetical protein
MILLLPGWLGAWAIDRLLEKKEKPFSWPIIGGAALAGFALYGLLAIRPDVLAVRAIIGALFSRHYLNIVFALLQLWLYSILLIPLLACMIQLFRARTAEQRMLQKEIQRKHKEQELARKAVLALKEMPEEVEGQIVIGATLGGDLNWKLGRWATYPQAELRQHGVVVGESRVGKTTTVYRINYGARKHYGWQVIHVDAKGDEESAAEFFAIMRAAGVHPDRIKVFPAQPYDGWRGQEAAIYNRLISIEDYTEPYYRDLSKLLLNMALRAPGASTPRDSSTLLARLNKESLQALYAGRVEESEIDSMSARDISGVRNRFRAFFGSLDGQLDGKWAMEDCDAAYILLKGLALKEEAVSLGRFFVEELAHYASERKPRHQGCLIILDDFSAILQADAANLLERLAVYNTSVFAVAQTEEALGKQADRLLGTTTTRILHRVSAPDRLLARAGTVHEVDSVQQVHNNRLSGGGSLRLRETYKVQPNEVRQLAKGQAVFISGGQAQKVLISPVIVEDADLEAARIIIEQRRKANAPATPPPPPAGQANNNQGNQSSQAGKDNKHQPALQPPKP